MKKLLLLLNSAFLILHSAFAQNPLVKQWDYRYGGTNDELLFSFQETTDGGFILGGYSLSGIGGDKTESSQGNADYWIIKLDSLGTLQWDKRFGGDTADLLTSIQQTTDGGYILGGHSMSGISGDKTQMNRDTSNTTRDYWIVKTDALGNKQWDARFGGEEDEYLYSVKQTADGGYVLGGYSNSGISGDKTEPNRGTLASGDYWMVKTDSLGIKQWDKTFGGSNTEYLHSLVQTADGGYMLGGASTSPVSGDKTQPCWDPAGWKADYWVVKIDALGNKQWDRRYGGGDNDWLWSLLQTPDDGYLLGGWALSGVGGDKTTANWGVYDRWIIKIDSIGNMQWEKDFGGTSGEDEFGNLTQTADGGFLVPGTSYSPISGDKTEANLGREQVWTLKTDALGNKQWDKTLLTTPGGNPADDEVGLAVQSRDGCYVFATYTSSGIAGDKTQPCWDATGNTHDYWIIKYCDTTSVPLANFSTSPADICPGSCIAFTNLSQAANSYQWIFNGATPSASSNPSPQNICYAAQGSYDVTLIASNGSNSDTITLSNYITVYPQPAIPSFTQSGDTLFATQGYTGYQWYDSSIVISGATNYFYIATHSGNYNIIVTDSNGCSVGAGILNVVAGTNQFTINNSQFAIYPNPASNTFTIQLPAGAASADVAIYNTLGEVVYTITLSSVPLSGVEGRTKTINTKFTAGIYFVRVVGEEKTYTQKLVIQ